MDLTWALSHPCRCIQWGIKDLRRHQVHPVAVSRMRMRCSGAFKFRGALNSILSLSDEQAAKGVVVHSSGNHAAAVALAAKIRGIPAHIVLPTDAPQVGSLRSLTLCCAITVQKGVMPSCLHPCCSERQRVLSCAAFCCGSMSTTSAGLWPAAYCQAESSAYVQCKVDAINNYGGIITPCAPTMEARESTAAEMQAQMGATFIPPYNYGPTICGQGTIALEFLQQACA